MKSATGLLLAVTIAMAPAMPGTGIAQSVIAASRFYKAVHPGGSVRMASYYTIDPQCRSLGEATVTLLTAPQGGQAATQVGSDFPSFAANNPRSACARKRVPATLLIYRAAHDYTGTDTFDVEVQYADGFARKYRYVVVVR